MIQENLRVTAQTVISQMLEGHKTFGDLAQKYDMTEEELKQIIAKIVNDKDYPRLVKANDKYMSLRSKPRKNKIQTPKAESEDGNYGIDKDLVKKRKELVEQMSYLEEQIAEKQTKKEEKEEKEGAAAVALTEAQRKLEEAEAEVRRVEEEYSKVENECLELVQKLEELKSDRENVNGKIQEIDSRLIFLVAPNYHGKKPDFGTLVSVIPMEGAKVEDVSNTTLTTEMSADDIFQFENMEDAKAANNYLKLVTKYFVEDKDYNLLIDNEVLIRLLQKQELIDEPDT